ncbi:MAG TPA: hypothetical protein VGR61_08790, partial [Candidatus Dormibacteraeota bacterium]|nr:hypothetical protein [Candidatus Dormibacteraeota bacterium]
MKVIRALNDEISDLEMELTASFEAHPDAEIIRSRPGLGVVLGARVLAEFGARPNSLCHCQAWQKLRRY